MKKKKTIKKIEKLKYYIDSSYVNLNDKDYLENYIYSDELSNKINNYFNSNCEKPLYIGVIGSWGSGKTSVVETSLDKFDKETIIYRYDAWKYEGDSFRRSFIQSILNQSVDKYKLKDSSKVYRNVSESLYEDYSISSNSIFERFKLSLKKDKKLSVFSILIIVILSSSLIIGGIYYISRNQISLGSVMTILGTLITLFGAMGLFDIFYSTIVYSKSKMFSSEQFYKSFTDILEAVSGDNNIILIDNLDRCNKDGLKKTLNTIKGFYVEDDESKLKDEKIVFIIPLDINSLEEAYSKNKVYYLDKIFDDTIYIKPKYNTDKLDFINRILDEYSDINSLINTDSKSIIINSVINTPREIIKILNDYVTEYNILLYKNGSQFVQNDKNRNYLMKTVIIKRLYYDFYQLAFSDLEKYIMIDRNPAIDDEVQNYNNYAELTNYLIVNRSISPTNYYDFYQNQNIKSYNQIPLNIKNAIMEHDIEVILEFKDKTKIIYYYNNIYDDFNNGFWNPNILNKYITLIELYKNNYFNEEELISIMNSWNKVFTNKKFNDLNVENVNIIGYENELIFGKEMYKNKTFNMTILDWIKDDIYKFETESEKYEYLSNWIIKNDGTVLDEKYSDLLNSYCVYLLNNNLYSNDKHLKVLSNGNIKLIKIENIKQFISINTDNKIVLDLINNLKKEHINNSQIIDALKNWLNTNKINEISVVISSLDYMIDNGIDISSININNNIDGETIDDENLLSIMSKYCQRNIYNHTLFNILKKVNNKKLIKLAISNLTTSIPDNNDEYIANFKDYFFGLPTEIKKENIHELAKVINKYSNYEEKILGRIINDNLLNSYYKVLKTSEAREHVIEISMKLLLSNFSQQIENIFVYESSSERMQSLISNHNSMHDYVMIINSINKKSMKRKVLNEFINLIKEKDNITDDEINLIKSLVIDDLDKKKINEILNTKETINKKLVGV